MNPTNQISTELASLLTPEAEILKPVPRLALSIEGLDKAGKTYWALMTAPDPIALVTNDPGTQTIVELARKQGKTIHQLVLTWEPPAKITKKASEVNDAEWTMWCNAWDKYQRFVAAVQRDRACRTWVTDTETDIWHLAELAFFGKAAGNSSMEIRPKLNEAYQKTFWALYKKRPDLNMIMIHRLKKKYVKGTNKDAPADWNGDYETDGFGRVAFLVDGTLRMEWDSARKDFVSYFDTGKAFRHYAEHNAHVLGKRWFGQNPDDPSAFWNLGLEIFPEADEKTWGI